MNLKNRIYEIALVLLLTFGPSYLLGAFMTFDFNIADWDSLSRLCFVLASAAVIYKLVRIGLNNRGVKV